MIAGSSLCMLISNPVITLVFHVAHHVFHGWLFHITPQPEHRWISVCAALPIAELNLGRHLGPAAAAAAAAALPVFCLIMPGTADSDQ
jgi:hypothetical protein